MHARHYNRIAIFLVVLLTSTGSQYATAQSWHDDFSDGSAEDGTPVTWTVHEAAEGTYNVVDGSYVATGNDSNVGGQVMSSDVRSAVFEDVSVQAQATISGSGAFGVGARGGDPNPFTGYGGSLSAGGFLAILRTDGDIRDPATPLVILNSATIGLSANAEVKLQLDIIGTNLSLTVWAADQAKPALPQLTASDSTYSRGWAGIVFQESESDPDAFASFRDVQAVAIPEPNSLAAILGGIFCFAICRKH